MILASFRNSIISAQVKYPKGLDIELRYGNFIENFNKKITFHPGVSSEIFNRLQEGLSKIAPLTKTVTKDQVSGDIRLITYENGKKEWVIKNRPVISHDIYEYGFRLSASQKTLIEPPPSFTPTLVRNKIRYSYPLAGGAVRVDLTKVNADNSISYEIEIQMLRNDAFDLFSKSSEIILRLIQDTIIIYTQIEKKEITSYFNNLLNGNRTSDFLKINNIKNFRNLKIEDLVYGGIIGNEKTGYKASHKIEGYRRFLVFSPNGIWLLGTPNQYTRLTDTHFPTMTGTVLEGQVIPLNKRLDKATKKPFWYIAYDILSWQGDLGVQNQPHSDRMKLVQLATDRFESPYMEINTMRFLSFNTPSRFFEVMNELISQKSLLAYKEDGIIFTPESTPYYLDHNKLSYNERILTKYADNLKWSPLSQIKIDLLYQKGKLYMNNKGSLEIFPYQGKIPEVDEGSIVRYNIYNGLLTMLNVRDDKNMPDNKDEIKEILDGYIITKDLLQGKTFELLEYHRQKNINNLYQPIYTEDTLLDLTPSPDNWSKFKKVIAYTDQKFNIPNVITVNDPEKIIDIIKNNIGKVSAIVMNKVVSEIFPYLQDIINETLEEDGRLEMMFLDASSCQEMFKPVFTPSLSLEKLDLNGLMTLKYDIKRQVLSNPNELQAIKANQLPLRISYLHRLDEENFLALHEKIYGRLYSFGRFVKNPTPTKSKNIMMTIGGDETTRTAKSVEKRSERVISSKPVNAPSLMINPSNKPTDREVNLASLRVSKPNDIKNSGIGDDVIEKVNVSWSQEELYRIACIGDGSCFFHAYFKGFYDDYQNDNSYEFRTNLVRGFRNELATLLTMEDPENKDKIFYETVANGSLARMGEEQEKLKELIKDDYGQPIDYSIRGMVKLLNSSRDVGDEIYGYASEIVGIGIYVMRGTNKDLYKQIVVGNKVPFVIIMGNGRHYEVIAAMRNGKLQTLFDPDDPIILSIK